MKQVVLVKNKTVNSEIGDVIEILPDTHVLTNKEKEMFDVVLLSDLDIQMMEDEIREYHKTAYNIGAIAKKVQRKYLNGKLIWQIVP